MPSLTQRQIAALRLLSEKPVRILVAAKEPSGAVYDELVRAGLCRCARDGLDHVYSITPEGGAALQRSIGRDTENRSDAIN